MRVNAWRNSGKVSSIQLLLTIAVFHAIPLAISCNGITFGWILVMALPPTLFFSRKNLSLDVPICESLPTWLVLNLGIVVGHAFCLFLITFRFFAGS